jgi:hypothetical protein
VVLAWLASSALVLAPRALSAQCTVAGLVGATCSLNRNITATVRRTVRVTVTATQHSLPTPTDQDFADGFAVAAGPTITVQANANWQVTVRSNNGTWSGTGGARGNKPRADLLWGTSGAGPWTAMTNTATVFATGAATAGTVAPIFYRVNWFFALDVPGTYTINTIYTISTT